MAKDATTTLHPLSTNQSYKSLLPQGKGYNTEITTVVKTMTPKFSLEWDSFIFVARHAP